MFSRVRRIFSNLTQQRRKRLLFRCEEVVPTINGFVANADAGDGADRFGSSRQHHVGRIHQVRIDVLCRQSAAALYWATRRSWVPNS